MTAFYPVSDPDWLKFDTDDRRFTAYRDVLPELPAEQYRAIKAAIEDGTWTGRLVTDQHGTLLLGHDAYRAFLALGVPPRHIFVAKVGGRGVETVRSLIRLWRYHDGGPITPADTRAAVREQLRLAPGLTDRAVARLFGTATEVVGRERASLAATEEAPRPGYPVGPGVTAGVPLVFANDRGGAERSGRLLAATAGVGGKTLSKRTVQRAKYLQDRQGMARLGESLATPADIHLFHRDFRRVRDDILCLGIGPLEADLIWADPPWKLAVVRGMYADLAAFALEWLKPGGLLGVYPSTAHKDTANDELRRHFRKVGELTVPNAPCGGNTVVGHLQATYQPVLLFSRGKPGRTLGFRDSFRPGRDEKKYHQWQRTEAETVHWLSRLTDPGQLVFDPFGGGFTTAACCLRLGRQCVSCDIDEESVAVGRHRLAEVSREMEAARKR